MCWDLVKKGLPLLLLCGPDYCDCGLLLPVLTPRQLPEERLANGVLAARHLTATPWKAFCTLWFRDPSQHRNWKAGECVETKDHTSTLEIHLKDLHLSLNKWIIYSLNYLLDWFIQYWITAVCCKRCHGLLDFIWNYLWHKENIFIHFDVDFTFCIKSTSGFAIMLIFMKTALSLLWYCLVINNMKIIFCNHILQFLAICINLGEIFSNSPIQFWPAVSK